jgi:hypothetical protein
MRREKSAPIFLLVPKLSGDVLQFVNLAVRSLRYETGIRIRVEAQRSRRHYPGLHQRLGVLDRDFVKEFIARAREFLSSRRTAASGFPLASRGVG